MPDPIVDASKYPGFCSFKFVELLPDERLEAIKIKTVFDDSLPKIPAGYVVLDVIKAQAVTTLRDELQEKDGYNNVNAKTRNIKEVVVERSFLLLGQKDNVAIDELNNTIAFRDATIRQLHDESSRHASLAKAMGAECDKLKKEVEESKKAVEGSKQTLVNAANANNTLQSELESARSTQRESNKIINKIKKYIGEMQYGKIVDMEQ